MDNCEDGSGDTLPSKDFEHLTSTLAAVTDATKRAVNCLLRCASNDGATFTAVLRLVGNGNVTGSGGISDNCDPWHSIAYDLAALIGNHQLTKAIHQCLLAVDSGACIADEIAAYLAGSEGCEPPEPDGVTDFLAEVEALPADVQWRRIKTSGLMGMEHIEPTTEPFGSLVRGLINLDSFVLVPGASGAGKTALALDMALCVAAGVPWRGRETRSGAVLYCASESADEVMDRVAAWKARHCVERAPLAVWSCNIDITTEAGSKALLQAVYDWQQRAHRVVSLVVLDTLHAAIGTSDENGAATMAAVIATVKRVRAATGAALMILHHTSQSRDSVSRGSNSLPAGAETIIRVDPGRASVFKQRGAEGGETFPFRIVSAPEAGGAGVIEHLPDAPAAATAKPGKPDPLPGLVKAVRDAAAAGAPFKLHGTGGLFKRREELPEILSKMGRNALAALSKSAIETGALVSSGGTLTAHLPH